MSKWLTINETADCTGFSRQWVHKRIADGTFKSEKKHGRYIVDGNSVQSWMEAEMESLKRRWTLLAHNLPNGYHGKPKTD